MKQADRKLTLEQLEEDYWPEHEYDNEESQFSHEYRKIPLELMGVEQVRFLLGRNIGNEYLLPIALEMLESDILISGNLHEGDLLMAVLASSEGLWKEEIEAWDRVCALVERNLERIKNSEDVFEGVKKEIVNAYKAFKKILARN